MSSRPCCLLVLTASLLVLPSAASGGCSGGEACAEPCPAENSCHSDAECQPGEVCQRWTYGLPCLPGVCACNSRGGWTCTADCAPQCNPINCDDGNPCTDDSSSADGCVHTPVGGAELIVLELPELTGFYSVSTERDDEISLGFSLSEIYCVSIRWAGSITTGAWSCVGEQPVGARVQFLALFLPEVSCLATHVETSQIIGAWIPFDSTDSFRCLFGDTIALLSDGVATLGVGLDLCAGIDECRCVPPYSSGQLNSVTLTIAARRMHDFNGDTRVNLDDMTEFVACLNASGGDPGFAECHVFDSDRDTDVDLADAAAFQRAFTGP